MLRPGKTRQEQLRLGVSSAGQVKLEKHVMTSEVWLRPAESV